MLGGNNSMGLVYSTDGGRMCPQCKLPVGDCRCAQASAQPVRGDGCVRLQRQTHGRGGKTVTTISGVDLPPAELKQLARRLKQLCGCGGSISAGIIEIQGDQRALIKAELERLGHTVKLAGG